jgi:hypothetical protein
VSALTKIFVLLNVVLSIVLAAGVVVWANRSENFAKTLNSQGAENKLLKAQVASQNDQIALLGGEKTQIMQSMQHQIDDQRTANTTLQSQLAQKDTDLATVNANLAQATAAQKSATDALTVAQNMIKDQDATIADARKAQTDLEKKSAELTFAVNDWTNKYEVVNRQERDDREQITQLQSDNRKYEEQIHKAGITANSPTINAEPLVNVSGVVRSTQNIGGVPYATIDVGSAVHVTKNMQFKVIDPKASDPFLGYLIVDRVEPNQAFGHLQGPHINEVRQGVEVRTQL